VQRVQRILDPTDRGQQPIIGRESFASHPLHEPIQLAEHRLQLVLERPGLLLREIVVAPGQAPGRVAPRPANYWTAVYVLLEWVVIRNVVAIYRGFAMKSAAFASDRPQGPGMRRPAGVCHISEIMSLVLTGYGLSIENSSDDDPVSSEPLLTNMAATPDAVAVLSSQ